MVRRRVLLGLCCAALARGRVHFSETFGEGWERRWTRSTWKEREGTAGKWVTSAGRWFRDEAEDTGLQTGEDSKFFGISAGFDSFSNKGKDLIVQYQLKYEQDVECGGGYLKIGPKLRDPAAFGDKTPYNIMFGPDQCGYRKRTHLIFHHENHNVLKRKDLPFKQEGEGVSHLYRLVLTTDNTVRVEVDEERVYEGSLKRDWDMLLPHEIPDLSEQKPDEWIDDSMMYDPNDRKPKGWVDEEDYRMPDTDAKKPADWNDEEDGEWQPPFKDNPAFVGEWVAKRIPNPDYIGFWEPKKLPNPKYVDNDLLYVYDDFGFVGVDVWQVKGGAIFDNIIITDDVAEADAFAKTWRALSEVEKSKKKEEDEAKQADAPADSVEAHGQEM